MNKAKLKWKRFLLHRTKHQLHLCNPAFEHRKQLRFKRLSMAINPSKPYLAGVTT
jgi:hypothetical protein